MSAIIQWPRTLYVQKYIPSDIKGPETKRWSCAAFCRVLTYPISSCIALLSKRCHDTSKDTLLRYSIQTRDHKTTFDALLLRGKIKKAVLFSLGSDVRYEELRTGKGFLTSMVQFIKQQLGDVNILIPNHPQTLNPSNERRVVDILSCYDMLIKAEHFQPDDVIVYGHAIGALYGAKAAAQIQQEHPLSKVNVVIDRSSVDLYQAKESMNQEKDGERKTHARKETNINIQAGVDALRGTIIAVSSKKDTTITPRRSFTANVNRDQIDDRLEVVNIGAQSEGADTHFAKFSQQEANLIGGHMRRTLGLEAPEALKDW